MPELTEEQRLELEEKIKNMSPQELQEFQKQQCIFCQIIAGKIPSKKVYEDEVIYGILDINPAAKGHILLLPKEHYTIMPQVPDGIIAHLFLVSKYLSQILLKTLKVAGTNIFIANGQAAGQRAQHFMLHVIPRKENDHVLEFREKLIPIDIQQKVKIVVEASLNKMLGIKKPDPSEGAAAKTYAEEDVKESQNEIISISSPRAKFSKPKRAKQPQANVKQKQAKAKQIKFSPKQTTSSLSKKKQETANLNETVNLDDIASLFK